MCWLWDAVRCAGAAVLWQETGMLECSGSVSAVNADVLCSKDDIGFCRSLILC